MKESAKVTEATCLDIAPADVNILNARDHVAWWKTRWTLDKYHTTDDAMVMPWDAETTPLLQQILQGSSERALRELEDLFLQRGADRYSKRDLDRADAMHGLKPHQLRHAFLLKPDEQVVVHGNLLMYGGASCLWQCLIGNGTTTAGQALTYFSNAQGAMGVGDSSTAAAATQTNLQAASNKLRVAMDATYPTHTDATTSGAATISFKSTFGNAQANYAWNELAIFNSTTDAVGRMLVRKVDTWGTKASGSWSMTYQVTLS